MSRSVSVKIGSSRLNFFCGNDMQLVDVRSEYVQYFVNEWRLRNACVAFHTRRNTSFVSQWISRQEDAAIIYGFSEYINGYQRVSWVRPELPSDNLESCARADLGLAILFPANNVYHAFFHAVPAWRTLLRQPVIRDSRIVPLVGEHAGHWFNAVPHAWEFMVRAFTRDSSQQIFLDLRSLLSARCTCFRRVIGNTEAFEPRSPASRSTLQSFCRTVLRNSARFLSNASSFHTVRHVLYVSRRGFRSLVNDENVTRLLSKHSARKLHLETLSLTDQMHLIAKTHLLITLHGQALAYMPFMTLSKDPTAILEISLPLSAHTWRSKLMYEKWALSLKIAYFSSKTAYSGHCNTEDKVRLRCTLVANLRDLRKTLTKVQRARRSRVQWCHRNQLTLCKKKMAR